MLRAPLKEFVRAIGVGKEKCLHAGVNIDFYNESCALPRYLVGVNVARTHTHTHVDQLSHTNNTLHVNQN